MKEVTLLMFEDVFLELSINIINWVSSYEDSRALGTVVGQSEKRLDSRRGTKFQTSVSWASAFHHKSAGSKI